MKLWLVRHAAPLVAPGVCYGRTDLAADAGQTWAVALELAQRLPRGLPVVSSPLRRCAALAHDLLALRSDLSLRIDDNIQEFDFGAWEGRPWDAIARTELDAWRDDFADHRPGGGESVRAFMQRVACAHDARRADAAWITHAGVMRAVELLGRGVRCPVRAAEWPAQPIPYGRGLVIEGWIAGE
jgi:alpha-ribazole phosphatase